MSILFRWDRVDALKKVSRRYGGKIQEKGFALPTVLILSIVLLAIGVSTLQVGAAISRSLVDQHWNRLAKTAGQSAVEFFSSCYRQGSSSSTATLTPNTTCEGAPVTPARDIYISSDTSATASPSRWRSTYTITPPVTGADAIARSKATGKVEILTPDNIVVKTYTWDYQIVINYDFTKAIYFDTQGSHTCALTAERLIYCSGKNTSGELGDNSTVNRLLPVKFQLPADNAVGLSMSGDITCAHTADQRIYCSGKNNNGQLGDGSFTNRSTPVQFQLPAGKAAAQLSSGSNEQVCAITTDQLVYCSGRNDSGELGDGSFTNRSTPVQFQLPAGKTAISVRTGGFSVCALTSDKLVYCAGKNNLGQFSDNTYTNRSTPVLFQLPVGKTSEKLFSGYNHVCVITSDKLVYCAGHNANGQLGDSTNTGRPLAVQYKLPVGKTAESVSINNLGTCVLTSDQLVYCAGRNDTGQWGDGTYTDRSTPILFQLPAGKTVAKLVIGRYNTCAITTDQLMYCAGANYSGQLSDGTAIERTTAVLYQLPANKKVSYVISSSNVLCVATTDQYGYCSGQNTIGQLGDGTSIDRFTAVRYLNP